MDIIGGLLMGIVTGYLVVVLLIAGGNALMDWYKRRTQRRIARIEAELDRTSEELRTTILSLAQHLSADAHEARKALIRESFLASGKVPPPS